MSLFERWLSLWVVLCIAAGVLLLWAVLDVARTRRREQAEARAAADKDPGPPAA